MDFSGIMGTGPYGSFDKYEFLSRIEFLSVFTTSINVFVIKSSFPGGKRDNENNLYGLIAQKMMAKMSYFRFWWARALLVDHHLQLSEKKEAAGLQ